MSEELNTLSEQDDTVDFDVESFDHIRHRKKRDFLRAYIKTATIRRAAMAAKISRTMFFYWQKVDRQFAAAFEDAKEIAFDVLSQEADRRATRGVKELVLHQGKPVLIPIDPMNPNGDCKYLYKRIYSDVLLMFLMKGLKPHIYRDNPPDAPPAPQDDDRGYVDFDELPLEQRELILEQVEQKQLEFTEAKSE